MFYNIHFLLHNQLKLTYFAPMTTEEFHEIKFHRKMVVELNNAERYPLLAVDFNHELITFRANDGYITHATINYVKKVIENG